MLLRTVYTVTPGSAGLDDVDLPLEIALAEGIRASLDKHEDGARLVLHRSVDAAQLEVVADSGCFRELPGGGREALPRLRLIGDEPPERVAVDDLVGAVTFLTDVPLALSRPLQADCLVPETEQDRELLQRLGTDQPYYETGARIATRTFSATVDADGLAALLTRSAGLRLYADVVKLTLDVARFRELWRVLESAFARTDEELVTLLASYAPAQQLGFDEAELRDLLVLRGRASHAQSKAGLRELVAVERDCAQRVARLKNLVERVILTKKSWGYPTTGVEELARLQASVGPSGDVVYSAEKPAI